MQPLSVDSWEMDNLFLLLIMFPCGNMNPHVKESQLCMNMCNSYVKMYIFLCGHFQLYVNEASLLWKCLHMWHYFFVTQFLKVFENTEFTCEEANFMSFYVPICLSTCRSSVVYECVFACENVQFEISADKPKTAQTPFRMWSYFLYMHYNCSSHANK